MAISGLSSDEKPEGPQPEYLVARIIYYCGWRGELFLLNTAYDSARIDPTGLSPFDTGAVTNHGVRVYAAVL
jgi:hypothetical protein